MTSLKTLGLFLENCNPQSSSKELIKGTLLSISELKKLSSYELRIRYSRNEYNGHPNVINHLNTYFSTFST